MKACFNKNHCDYKGFGIDPKHWNNANNWCMKKSKCKYKRTVN